MRHNLPPTPAFRDSPSLDAGQEIALRLIAESPSWQFYHLGTAVLIGGGLAITAKQVLEYAFRRFGTTRTDKGGEVSTHSIRLVQVLRGPTYRFWNVSRAWITSTDIAILHIGLDRTSEDEPNVEWKVPVVRVVPPPSGSKVLAFGYREATIEVLEKSDGSHHIEMNDKPTTSIGEVGQIFAGRRDSSMLTFPCFEVRARFAPGMSGGMVIDEDGALCGLVCAGCDFGDPTAMPLSYAATLWPMLTTVISIDRGESYPRGVDYPMIDLALDGLINVVGLEQLDPSFFHGRVLPPHR
jgi:Trypsin-like peptidase domain